jgi:TRAP-type uncharacterized transport system substrate-binding protein
MHSVVTGKRQQGRSRIRLLLIWSIVSAVFVLAVGFTIKVVGPVPPRTVVMTTGAEGGDYHQLGMRYKEILARSGVHLELLPSNGAVENLKRLNAAQTGVSVGFVQGRLATTRSSPDLVSLGTIFQEPLWIFHRGGQFDRQLKVLRGKRVSIGPPESGTRALVLELMWRNRVDTESARLLPLTSPQAVDALLRGEIDVAFIVAAWDAESVQKLLADESIAVASFPQIDAYLALYPYLTKLILPAGVMDLAKLRPSSDVVMLATKTSLLVRKDLHPAIQYLLLDAAQKIHSAPAVFQRAGQFPAPEVVDVPISDEALNYYKTGPPFLQRYLPFWLAVLAGRLLVILIPVIGVLFPLVRFVPLLYGWGIRRRIFRLYGELKFLEAEMELRDSKLGVGDLLARLDRLEDRANHLRVPTMFAQLLYTLRHHITLVRQRLASHAGPRPAAQREK